MRMRTIMTNKDICIWAPVVLQSDHDILGIREDQLSPSLPQWVHDVRYEPNLKSKDNDDNDNNNEDENDDDNRLSLNITLTLHQPVTFLWWHCSYHTWETHPVPRHALCPPGEKGVTIWNNSMFWLLKYINLKIKTFVMCTFNLI